MFSEWYVLWSMNISMRENISHTNAQIHTLAWSFPFETYIQFRVYREWSRSTAVSQSPKNQKQYSPDKTQLQLYIYIYIYIHRALKLRSLQGLGIFDDQNPSSRFRTEFLSLPLVAKQRHLASNSRCYSPGQRKSILMTRLGAIERSQFNLIVKINFDNVQ